MGSGFYSTRLPYKAWYDFNNAQRAHYNFVESIASILTLLIIGGIYYPVVAAVFGFVYFIGRIIYSIGYTMSGSSGRLIGVLILDVAILALFVLSIITGYKFIRGIPPYLI
jgi:glutathione S-transferase